jgi:hypothetical protein
MACARPHLTAAPGETVTLDGGRSLCEGSEITGYRWTFHDGQTREGVRVSRAYAREGMYSEMLTVTDARGRTDVDFCVVQILPPDGDPRRTPPSMHLTCYPTDGIRAGQPVAFKVRTFFRGDREAEQGGAETWDFGDGKRALSRSGERARVPACADLDFDERWHAYDRPGRYIVTVSRAARNGLSATAQVKVSVAS